MKQYKTQAHFSMTISKCVQMVKLSAKENKLHLDENFPKTLCKNIHIIMDTSPFETDLIKPVLIMLTSPCNADPLIPHLYIVKLGFKEVCTFSHFCLKT